MTAMAKRAKEHGAITERTLNMSLSKSFVQELFFEALPEFERLLSAA